MESLETATVTLESLQNDDLVYGTGLDVLQLGLSEQGFGVEVPELDFEESAEHRGRLTGLTAVTMGSLALAAPSGVSAEQADSAPGIVVATTTGRYDTNLSYASLASSANQADYVKVLPLKYRKINSRCGIEAFKIRPTVGKLQKFGARILSNTAPRKYRYTKRAVATLDETGIKIPARVCHIKNTPSTVALIMSAEGKDFTFRNYVFNWSKKKWVIRK